LQLADPESDTHFIYVFHNTCDGDFERVFHPAGLDEKKMYTVTEFFPEEQPCSPSVTGAELARNGITATVEYNQLEGFRGKLFLVRSL
jgi:hypothetical protein